MVVTGLGRAVLTALGRNPVTFVGEGGELLQLNKGKETVLHAGDIFYLYATRHKMSERVSAEGTSE